MSDQWKEIAEKLQKSENVEEVIAVCQAYGQEITPQQAQQALELLNEEAQALSLNDLDNVAGGEGMFIQWIKRLCGK